MLNKNEHRNCRVSYAPKREDDAGATGPIFLILSWRRVIGGRHRPDFFELTVLEFVSCSLPTV